MKNIFQEDIKRIKNWPEKHQLIGVNVSAVSYDEALDLVIKAATIRKSTCMSHLAVHGLVEASIDPLLKSKINEFDIVAPDGQPVRLAMNLLYNTKILNRCYGPAFMLRVCQKAANEQIGVYLYGSYLNVVRNLRKNLLRKIPNLKIVGCEPSAFRPLRNHEDKELIERINKSGAGIVFIGLGSPLQEKFAYEHKKKIKGVQICVGAAFDFHSNNKKMAPRWMQQCSLEWFYRLLQEPRRLWKRYLYTNTTFLLLLFLQIIKKFTK